MLRKQQRTFWERTREALQDAGLPPTQAYVADKILHVKQPSISDWNKPGGFPMLENGIKLAAKLNVCVEWLYLERGPKRPTPDDITAQRLWDIRTQLDDVTKGELVGIASANLQLQAKERPQEGSDSAAELQRRSSRSSPPRT